ncbi:MAG: heavy metal translocating P-type ATPase metal-binding domain-containing protein [Verrucomicrobiae bacterium]|nr:heavy metal translocating P-type ATPase metal-binding domain-containing protein [Verrucomicrobiae bacterium]
MQPIGSTPTHLAGLPAGVGLLPGLAGVDGVVPGRGDGASGSRACRHCGEPCPPEAHEQDGYAFCCLGCRTVYVLLQEHGLGDFYRLSERPGVRVTEVGRRDRWAFLDDPEVRRRLVDFEDGRQGRVTFRVPSMHCVACVWLLENLYRFHAGIGSVRANFLRREVSVVWEPGRIRLSEVAGLLEQLGYTPALTLEELDRPGPVAKGGGLGLRIGVAGFAFGNVMLFSLPQYLGLDSASGETFRTWFGGLSLLLALPALLYSASDFWRSAWASVRQRALTLDVPIAAGLAALYAQSAGEILLGIGEGYLDSLTGLIFFLLCGRAFQNKTHDRLGFDRDYRGFFPLSAVRRTESGEETVAISELRVGDRLTVRHGELVPADARLTAGEGWIDYSFVTGEAEPVGKGVGDHLFAGGRQAGGAIEVETVKPVSQSYLTSLWNDEAFRKVRERGLQTLTNRYSRRFTVAVGAIAVGSALGWVMAGDGVRGLKAFTSVLIVACPCALALAAPFTLGTAHRVLGRLGVFLRNAEVAETLAEIDTVALDKTGTLTDAEAPAVRFVGQALGAEEAGWAAALCRQSVHPHARSLARSLASGEPGEPGVPPEVEGFREVAGRGMVGRVAGREVVLGSAAWLREHGMAADGVTSGTGATVHFGLGGRRRGMWVLEERLRPEVDELLRDLGGRCHLALLSGDHGRQRDRFATLFGDRGRLHFDLGPHDKLAFVRRLQGEGHRVMMVGDGLNDAGALRQGDVGVAVVEGVGRFSPASDVILEAGRVPRLGRVLAFARTTTNLVRVGFGISAAYNVVGVSIAAAGILSPLICAVLMPISSVSVVLFAVGATHWAARRAGLGGWRG